MALTCPLCVILSPSRGKLCPGLASKRNGNEAMTYPHLDRPCAHVLQARNCCVSDALVPRIGFYSTQCGKYCSHECALRHVAYGAQVLSEEAAAQAAAGLEGLKVFTTTLLLVTEAQAAAMPAAPAHAPGALPSSGPAAAADSSAGAVAADSQPAAAPAAQPFVAAGAAAMEVEASPAKVGVGIFI